MRTFGDYPNVLSAIVTMYYDNGILNRTLQEKDLKNIRIPNDAWRATMLAAEITAQTLATAKLSDYIPTDMIDTDLASPDDNALECLATGEDSVQKLLVTWCSCNALETVLESAFDGELHTCLTTVSKDAATA